MVESAKTDRRKFMEQTGFAAIAGFANIGAKTKSVARDASLAKGGQGQAAIVIGRNAGTFYRWVAGELQKYLRLLTGCGIAGCFYKRSPARRHEDSAGGTRQQRGGLPSRLRL